MKYWLMNEDICEILNYHRRNIGWWTRIFMKYGFIIVEKAADGRGYL
ncbi:hypothetical protein HIF96_07155 [Helcococcus kunzii]|nr:hypothetical protein [Helcococcus kunzii]QZO76057.1 hypothetical protein HIF96_07155 [Helcococcus kunzii]